MSEDSKLNLWDLMSSDKNKAKFVESIITFVLNNLKDAFGYCCRMKLSLKEYCPKERFGGNINQATVFASVRLAEMWENGCYESLKNLFGMREIDSDKVKRWTTSYGDLIILNEIWEIKTSQAKNSFTGATHSNHKSERYILINYNLNWNLKLDLITPKNFIPYFAIYLVKFPNDITKNEIWKGKPTNHNSFTTLRIKNEWVQNKYIKCLHGDLIISKNKYAKIVHQINPIINNRMVSLDWHLVDNSNDVKRISYDEINQLIYVNFKKNDSIYFWEKCTEDDFDQSKNYESIDKFVAFLDRKKKCRIKVK